MKKLSEIVEKPYEHYPIDGVQECDECLEISFDNGTVYGLNKSYSLTPKVGDTIYLWEDGIGLLIRGIAINDDVAFYRTVEEQKEIDKFDDAERDRKQNEEFEHDKDKMDAEYDALPKLFRQRIDKFRKTNPNFRWKFERYEMLCCKDAVLIAETLKTPEAVQAFSEKDYSEQKLLVPGINDGHSGNSWNCAVLLAKLYVSENPEYVVLAHGVLTALVGCDKYGCPHPYVLLDEE